ncbi:MAG: hypothetical protein IIA45_03435 [Bacteroidetes bacterium]|nr:hypothetical protein [Bacteroidota bacterium]
MKKMGFILLSLLLLLSVTAPAQNTDREGTNILYKNEFVIGPVGFHSYGFSTVARSGKNITYDNKRIIEFELVNIRHPKELKQTNEFLPPLIDAPNPKAYYYGKQNSFFAIRTGVGQMRLIYEKAKKNGVQVRYLYLGGFSLGVVKPYYLNILYLDEARNVYFILTEKYDSSIPDNTNKFLDWYTIYGAAGFSEGWKEVRFLPGAYGKLGLNFEWASYDDLVKSVEVGIAFDIYPKKVPIMIIQDNKLWFPSLYINMILGWKWE